MNLTTLAILLLCLLVSNCIIMWIYIHKQSTEPVLASTNNMDVTIVIPQFEHFENNIVETVANIQQIFPDLEIIVVSVTTPYPYIRLPGTNSKFVIRAKHPLVPGYLTNPLSHIHTEFVLIIPDSVRLNNNLSKVLWNFRNTIEQDILVAPIISPLSSCNKIDINLKLWTLKYLRQLDFSAGCDSFNRDVAILTRKNLLMNLSDAFQEPFFQSFFVQAKLHGYKINVLSTAYFTVGKILFADQHKKWKHSNNIQVAQNTLYLNFGIKYVVDENGLETWHGCSRKTPRCFPSVIDAPHYLNERRWTPPCCLNGLRITARHVIRSLEDSNVKYWLEGGSLLGAARYADIIPWDFDVDLGILMDDISKHKALSSAWKGIRQIDEDGFVWEKALEGEFVRVQYSEINHLHVDLFPFYERNGVMTKDSWFKTHQQDKEFPAHFLEPLDELRFVGLVVSVPNSYKDFLEMKFGRNCIKEPKYPFPEKLSDPHF